MSGTPAPSNRATSASDEATVESDAVASLPVIETSHPPPRHMRQQNSARSLNSTGSAADASKKARLTTLAPATKPGVSYVREQLAATESGAVSATAAIPSKIDANPSLDTLVTASTESYDDYVARKRRMNSYLVDIENNYGEDDAEVEAEVDPYAHLRNQPRRPKTVPVAYEVEATPVFDDDDKGEKRRNPLKDWRVLLFLALALSAIVGLTVALLMQNNNNGNGNDGSQSAVGGIDVSGTPEPVDNVNVDNESEGGNASGGLEPTRMPTLSPVDQPVVEVTPTRSPIDTVPITNTPTSSPVATIDVPLLYKFEPFTMHFLTSTQLDQNKLVAAVSNHLIPFVSAAVPNLLNMSLNVDLSAPRNKRHLRSLQSRELQLQFASYTATFSGEIRLRDNSFSPSESTVEEILNEAFSGSNLDAFILDELKANARINIGAIVVMDGNGEAVGRSKTYSPVNGSLQTPLTNRFTRAGVMFDITAKNFPVKITRIGIHTIITENDVPVEVFIKTGSYVGYEQDESSWTPQNGGEPYVLEQGLGLGKITPIPEDQFQSFTIPAGQTIGVYITMSEDSRDMFLGQTSQLGDGNTENSLVEIQSGSSVGYRFGAVNPGRAWGGSIRYELGQA